MIQLFQYLSLTGLVICMFWLLRTWNAYQNSQILKKFIEDQEVMTQHEYEFTPVHHSTEKQLVFQKIDRK